MVVRHCVISRTRPQRGSCCPRPIHVSASSLTPSLSQVAHSRAAAAGSRGHPADLRLSLWGGAGPQPSQACGWRSGCGLGGDPGQDPQMPDSVMQSCLLSWAQF